MNCNFIPNINSRWLVHTAFSLVFLLSLGSANASEFSALGVSPTRVVIAATEKSGSITITNNSEIDITYRMKLIEMGRDNKGQFRRLSSEELPANHRSAAKLVRFSPRQVQLSPGQSQVIRAIARKPRNLAPGEYRSHLEITALPIISDQSLTDLLGGDNKAVLVQANSGTSVGISMPIILRHGQTRASVQLKSVQLVANRQDKITSAIVDLGLNGNQSTYGHIKLQLENHGSWQDIGLIRGYALYTPYPGNQVRIPVSSEIPVGQITAKSKVRVIFENPAAASDQDNHWLDGAVVPQIRKFGQ